MSTSTQKKKSNTALPSQQYTAQDQPQLIAQSFSYSSPLPPPQVLEKYEAIFPGAIERIFSLTEREALHRHSIYPNSFKMRFSSFV